MKANENDILEAVYRAGAEDGLKSYKKEMKARIEQAIAEEQEERTLFTIQRILGLALMFAALAVGIIESEWFAAIVIIPLAILLLLSNELVITRPEGDDYDA